MPPSTRARTPSRRGRCCVALILRLWRGVCARHRSIGAAGLLHTVETGATFVASADTFLRMTTSDQPLVLYRAAERFE